MCRARICRARIAHVNLGMSGSTAKRGFAGGIGMVEEHTAHVMDERTAVRPAQHASHPARWPRQRPRRVAGAPTYAALDLGTNNCRLLIAQPTHDSFRVIDAFSRIIRLGAGVSSS